MRYLFTLVEMFLPILSLREREAAEKKKKEDEDKRNTGANKSNKKVIFQTY